MDKVQEDMEIAHDEKLLRTAAESIESVRAITSATNALEQELKSLEQEQRTSILFPEDASSSLKETAAKEEDTSYKAYCSNEEDKEEETRNR